MKRITVQTIITSISSRGDGSLRFSAVTPELSTEEKVEVMKLQNQVLEGVFIPHDVPQAPELVIDREIGVRTPSQRLRSIMYIYHQQQAVEEDFNTWYLREMERLIEVYKRRLE